MIAAYGLGATAVTYDRFVQLWLNLPAVTAATNFNRTLAHIIATNRSALPDSWITAAVPDRIEASRWRQWDMRRTGT